MNLFQFLRKPKKAPVVSTAKHRSPTNERNKWRREVLATEEVVERKFFADLEKRPTV